MEEGWDLLTVKFVKVGKKFLKVFRLAICFFIVTILLLALLGIVFDFQLVISQLNFLKISLFVLIAFLCFSAVIMFAIKNIDGDLAEFYELASKRSDMLEKVSNNLSKKYHNGEITKEFLEELGYEKVPERKEKPES